VSCTTSIDCTAVGSDVDATHEVTLAAHWNGVSWAADQLPNHPGASANSLLSVSCPAAGFCEAVGVATAGGKSVALADQLYDSGWTLQSTPPPTGAHSTILESVECPTALMCMAVGGYGDSLGNDAPLAATYS
jgi:hypothetical protein